MRTPPFRTLIAEDHEGFRRFLCQRLEEKKQCEVIAQVSDGLEAVEKAEQLQPDLILLDLGLPKLNGIEVARRVRKLCPDSKILFLSQDSSPDIAQGAFRSGAHGYLLKSDAADLPLAVDAVLQGRRFVSARVGVTAPDSFESQ
jgi:DNA-binding NarL/FixJ family response regulator